MLNLFTNEAAQTPAGPLEVIVNEEQLHSDTITAVTETLAASGVTVSQFVAATATKNAIERPSNFPTCQVAQWDASASVAENLGALAMAFSVRKLPAIALDLENDRVIPTRSLALVRDDSDAMGAHLAAGFVAAPKWSGNRANWTAADNVPMFEEIVKWAETLGGTIETFGQYDLGAQSFAVIKLREFNAIGRGDVSSIELLCTFGHDGKTALTMQLRIKRHACDNMQMLVAVGAGIERLTHKAGSMEKVQDFRQRVTDRAESVIEEYSRKANTLASVAVTDEQAIALIQEITGVEFKTTKDGGPDLRNKTVAIARDYVHGAGQEAVRGTASGVFNAVTHWLTHNATRDGNEAGKLLNSLTSQALARKAEAVCLAFCQQELGPEEFARSMGLDDDAAAKAKPAKRRARKALPAN